MSTAECVSPTEQASDDVVIDSHVVVDRGGSDTGASAAASSSSSCTGTAPSEPAREQQCKKRARMWIQAIDEKAQQGFSSVECESSLRTNIIRKLHQAPPADCATHLDLDHILSQIPYQSILENYFGNETRACKPPQHELPLISKAYEESFMRQPHASENACVMGNMCECQFIDSSAPFTAVEFRLFHDAPKQQMCVLCSRRTTQKLFYDMCFTGKSPCGVIQRYGNIFGQPGEYSAECMLACPNGAFLHCMPLPIMSHQRNKYTVHTNGGIKYLQQHRVAYEHLGVRVRPLCVGLLQSCSIPDVPEGELPPGEADSLLAPLHPVVRHSVAWLQHWGKTGHVSSYVIERRLNMYLALPGLIHEHGDLFTRKPWFGLLFIEDVPCFENLPDLWKIMRDTLQNMGSSAGGAAHHHNHYHNLPHHHNHYHNLPHHHNHYHNLPHHHNHYHNLPHVAGTASAAAGLSSATTRKKQAVRNMLHVLVTQALPCFHQTNKVIVVDQHASVALNVLLALLLGLYQHVNRKPHFMLRVHFFETIHQLHTAPAHKQQEFFSKYPNIFILAFMEYIARVLPPLWPIEHDFLVSNSLHHMGQFFDRVPVLCDEFRVFDPARTSWDDLEREADLKIHKCSRSRRLVRVGAGGRNKAEAKAQSQQPKEEENTQAPTEMEVIAVVVEPEMHEKEDGEPAAADDDKLAADNDEESGEPAAADEDKLAADNDEESGEPAAADEDKLAADNDDEDSQHPRRQQQLFYPSTAVSHWRKRQPFAIAAFMQCPVLTCSTHSLLPASCNSAFSPAASSALMQSPCCCYTDDCDLQYLLLGHAFSIPTQVLRDGHALVQVFALPSNVRELQRQSLHDKYANPMMRFVSSRLLICMHCLYTKNSLHNKFRLHIQTEKIICSECLQHTVVSVDVLGRSVLVQNVSYILCPACCRVHPYRGDAPCCWISQCCQQQPASAQTTTSTPAAAQKNKCEVCHESSVHLYPHYRVNPLEAKMQAVWFCYKHQPSDHALRQCMNVQQVKNLRVKHTGWMARSSLSSLRKPVYDY